MRHYRGVRTAYCLSICAEKYFSYYLLNDLLVLFWKLVYFNYAVERNAALSKKFVGKVC